MAKKRSGRWNTEDGVDDFGHYHAQRHVEYLSRIRVDFPIGSVWSLGYKYGYALGCPPLRVFDTNHHIHPIVSSLLSSRLCYFFAVTVMKISTSSSLIFATLAMSSSSTSLAAPAGETSQATGMSTSSSNHHVASRRGSFNMARSDAEGGA